MDRDAPECYQNGRIDERLLTPLSTLRNNLDVWNSDMTIIWVVINNKTQLHYGQYQPVIHFDGSNGQCHAKIVAFGDQSVICDKLLETGKAYYMSKFDVIVDGQTGEGLRYNDAPITLTINEKTWIGLDVNYQCGGQAERLKFCNYKTVRNILTEAELYKPCDVIGKVSHIGCIKVAGGHTKMEMQLSDSTGSIMLTMWEKTAIEMAKNLQAGAVLAIKDCDVKFFNWQKVLCTIPSSTIYPEPADHAGQLIDALPLVE